MQRAIPTKIQKLDINHLSNLHSWKNIVLNQYDALKGIFRNPESGVSRFLTLPTPGDPDLPLRFKEGQVLGILYCHFVGNSRVIDRRAIAFTAKISLCGFFVVSDHPGNDLGEIKPAIDTFLAQAVYPE